MILRYFPVNFFNAYFHASSRTLLQNYLLNIYTLNKKLVKVGHVGIKVGSSLVNHLVD